MERIGVAPGTEVGGYRILAPLGHGGMGAVYRAVDGEGATVALKLLHPHLAADADARERLRREVAHLQRVRHPGVARVLDAEIESSEAFIVTELIDGVDLGAHVDAHGSLSPTELADLAEQLRGALTVVHGAGVLHRDLTPGNVLVTARGPVLIDFGIAQAADDARVTSTGLVIGTPGYLSPELLEGGEPSTAGDWWGWAALLAFAATGRPPFGVRPLQTVLARARSGDADLEGLDRRTSTVLRSALAVDPWRRASPEEVVTELRRAADGEPDLDPATEVVPAWAAGPAGGQPPDDPATGGGTRVMPAGGPAPTVADDPDGYGDTDVYGEHGEHGDDGYGDDGYGDDEYGDGAYGDVDDADGYGDGYGDADGAQPLHPDGTAAVPAPPEPRRRVGTVLAVGSVLLALGAVRPGAALAVAVGLAVLTRTVGVAVSSFHGRRARRGVGRGDVARVALGSPWYLLRGVLGVLPAALVAASTVVVLGGVGWWLVDTGRLVVAAPGPGETAGELAGNAEWVTPALLGAVALVGLLMVWFGPMSRTTRVGARWVLGALAPGRAGAATLVLLALVALVLVLGLLVLDHPTVWWPLPGPPDLR